MNKKKNIHFHWLTPAQAATEADRIEQLQEERRAARRLAHEMFLIRARAAQDEEEKKREAQFWTKERQAWDETMMQIQMIHLIHQAYGE
jgi:hypothetical protein